MRNTVITREEARKMIDGLSREERTLVKAYIQSLEALRKQRKRERVRQALRRLVERVPN